jgi:hypothetical protein
LLLKLNKFPPPHIKLNKLLSRKKKIKIEVKQEKVIYY